MLLKMIDRNVHVFCKEESSVVTAAPDGEGENHVLGSLSLSSSRLNSWKRLKYFSYVFLVMF